MLRLSNGLLLLTFCVSALLAAPAKAVVVYDWSGTCTSGCVGTATGVLTLADSYTPGTLVSANDFVSWSYASSSGSYSFPGDAIFDPTNSFENSLLGSRDGPLPVGSGSGAIVIDAVGFDSFFVTDFPGVGQWESEFALTGVFDDSGTAYEWSLRATQIPLPQTALLLGTALAGLGIAVRRKR